jgi:hypothetical protein
MRIHFSQIFWGLLLVILNLSINGFDLLVDGVGYLLAAAGCGGLATLSPRFATARALCFVLAALWLVGFAVPGPFATIYGVAITVVNCMMIWQLLGGIREFALERQRLDLAQRAETRRAVYLVIVLVTSLLALVLSGSRGMGPLVVILVVSVLVVMAMILHLIYRVRNELAT